MKTGPENTLFARCRHKRTAGSRKSICEPLAGLARPRPQTELT